MSLPDLGMISRKPVNPALTAYFNFEFPRHSPESFLDWPIAGLASSVSGEPRLSIDSSIICSSKTCDSLVPCAKRGRARQLHAADARFFFDIPKSSLIAS